MPRLNILPDKREIDLSFGETMLSASLRAGIAHTHACGGQARCSTCRVAVVDGLEACEPRNALEKTMAERLNFPPEIRLACQACVNGNVAVRRLALDQEDVALITSALEPGKIGEEKTLAILFTDIRGFTRFSESLPSYDVIHVLDRYFDLMGKVIDRHGGCVDNYMGDGMLALFGMNDSKDLAINAVRAGLEMLQELENFKPYLNMLYGATFDMGIGVHVGEAVVGTIGSGARKRRTAIGDSVNFASRIESSNKKLGTRFLISAETRRLVDKFVETKGPMGVPVAGKTGTYDLFEVLQLK